MSGTVERPGPADETLMWEVRCEPGRGSELLAWAWQALLPSFAADERVAAWNVYRSAAPDGERLVVIVDYDGKARAGWEPPAPPPGLAARDPHQWVFERLDVR